MRKEYEIEISNDAKLKNTENMLAYYRKNYYLFIVDIEQNFLSQTTFCLWEFCQFKNFHTNKKEISYWFKQIS